jgi:hypothetical protein
VVASKLKKGDWVVGRRVGKTLVEGELWVTETAVLNIELMRERIRR